MRKPAYRGLAAALLLVAGAASCGSPHPSDRALVDEFRAHRADYDRLATLAQADGQLDRISYGWYRTATGDVHRSAEPALLPAPRWEEYRRLFKRLRLMEGVAIGRDGVYLDRSVSGLAIAGSTKGFAWLPRGADAECPSLDRIPHTHGGDSCFRLIEGSWYLFLDWT